MVEAEGAEAEVSETYPEQQPQQGTFLTKKYGGIPGVVWLAGAAVVAYFLFFRGKSSSGATSSGGGGTPTTGDISITPGTSTVNVTDSSPVPGPRGPKGPPGPKGPQGPPGKPPPPGGHHKHHTKNPQPKHHPPPRKKKHSLPVTHRAKAPNPVSVGSRPGTTSVRQIAQRSGTSKAEMQKLNPGKRVPPGY